MHADSKLPTDEQRRKLCDMLHNALVEIRGLSWDGRARQAADLADAFHNLRQEMWRDYFSFSFFRTSFLEPYCRRWSGEGVTRDYLAALEAIQGHAP